MKKPACRAPVKRNCYDPVAAQKIADGDRRNRRDRPIESVEKEIQAHPPRNNAGNDVAGRSRQATPWSLTKSLLKGKR